MNLRRSNRRDATYPGECRAQLGGRPRVADHHHRLADSGREVPVEHLLAYDRVWVVPAE